MAKTATREGAANDQAEASSAPTTRHRNAPRGGKRRGLALGRRVVDNALIRQQYRYAYRSQTALASCILAICSFV